MAGCIAAINNNETGICGIAGGQDGNGGVRIMSCETLRDDPDDDTKTLQGNSAEAMVWAADNGAVIMNNSWCTRYDSEEDAMKGGVSGPLKNAIDYFIQYAGCDMDGNQLPDSPMKGGVVFFGAGNQAQRIGWPAAYEPVIAVAATSASFTRAYYSNYGDWVDICAPGGDYELGNQIFSCINNGKYGLMQGTSMSCPQVTGVAALIASYFGGVGFTNEMLKERLLGGARHIIDGMQIGPFVDALGAFAYGGITPPEAAEIEGTEIKSNFVTVSWKVTEDPDDNKAYGFILVAAKDKEALLQINPKNPYSEGISLVRTVETGEAAIGETISGTLSGLEFETDYYVGIISYDYNQNFSAVSGIKKVHTGSNHAPEIKTEFTGAYVFKAHETLIVPFTVVDPDGHDFKMVFETGSKALVPSLTGNDLQLRFKAKDAPTGKYKAVLRAIDDFGMAGEYSLDYEVLENHAPTVSGAIDNIHMTALGQAMTIDLTKYFADEDGETLAYEVSTSTTGSAHVNVSEGTMHITALGFGLTDVSVSATDVRGETCSIDFRVLVDDNSKPVYLYPNPVSKTLFIRPAVDGSFDVSISNKAGAIVFSASSEMSPFSPFAVEMTGLASGLYYVSVKGNGVDGVYPIAKI